MDIGKLKARLSATTTVLSVGRVLAVTGLSVRAALPAARVGDVVVIRRKGEPLLGEIVGFDEGVAVVLPLGALSGVGPDDPVEWSTGSAGRSTASRKWRGSACRSTAIRRRPSGAGRSKSRFVLACE